MNAGEQWDEHGGAAVRALLLASTLIVLAVSGAIIGRKILMVDETRRGILHAEASATAVAARAHVTRVLRAADLSMFGFASALKTQHTAAPCLDARVRHMLAAYRGNFNDEFWLLFVDAEGIGVAASNSLPVRGMSYADRDYFKAHAGAEYPGGLYVSELTQGRVSGRPLFVLSRRVESADGKFLGVIAAPVNASTLAKALETIRINRNTTITLTDRNGKRIARAAPETAPAQLKESDAAFLPVKAETLPASGMFASVSKLEWIRAEQRLDPLPLTVAVDVPSEIWTPELKAEVALGSAGMLFMMVVLLLAGGLAVRLNVRLERSEAHYRRLYDSMKDGVVLVNLDGQIEACNHAFLELAGCGPQELVGSSFSRWVELPWRDEDSLAARRAALKRFAKSGIECSYRRKSGDLIHVNVKMWYVERAVGSGPLMCALVRDISEGKRAQDALRKAHAVLERKVQQRTLELTNIISLMRAEIAERKQMEDKLRSSQEQLRKLAAYREDIREGERQRIAREIHDELGGFLTVIKANLSVARRRARERDEKNEMGAMDEVAAAGDSLLDDTMGVTDRAIDALRRVIADLRPSVLDHLGVWAALKWYAGQIQERTGLECECIIDEGLNSFCLTAEHETMIFRITQEALTNVIRHAGATRATIRAFRVSDSLVVEVEDNGKGIEAQHLLGEESWGILGMHERTRHFGGELRITGAPGQGTVVTLRMSLEARDVMQQDTITAG